MYVYHNPNPDGKRNGDCTIRALCNATGQDWESVYIGLALEGLLQCDMPSANVVWGAYLRKHGCSRFGMPDGCPDCYTVQDFCKSHQKGVFVLALPRHVVAVVNGDYLDTWDSGQEPILYYFGRKEQNDDT